MSGTRRRRDTLAPSLFPFLAVLLCTMGSLVLILMLIVAGAQSSAKAVVEEAKLRAEDAQALLVRSQIITEEKLDDGRVVLEKKRLVLQHLEEHIREIMDELEGLARTQELIDAEQVLDEAAEEDRKRAISELEKQLAEAKAELEKKIDKPEGDKPIFAIIPYQGTNGTHRRPIYLECTADGVFIQPEGVRVTLQDLEPPYGPGNPLDAAIRRARAEFPPSNGAVTSTAYPLLIVRPSGIESYSMARAALSGWDDQFGYELISEDIELAFPASAPGLKAKLTQAIDLARERQAALVMAMPNQYRQARADNFPTGQRAAGGSADGLWSGDGDGYGSAQAARGLRDVGSDGRSGGGGAGARGGYSLDGEALPGDAVAGGRPGGQNATSGNESGAAPGSLGFAPNFGQAADAAAAGGNARAEGMAASGGLWGPNQAGDEASQFGDLGDASGVVDSGEMSQNGNSSGNGRGGATPRGAGGTSSSNGQSSAPAGAASSSGSMASASGAASAGQFQMPTSLGMNSGGANGSGDSHQNQNSPNASSSSRPQNGAGQSSQQAQDAQSSDGASFSPQLTFTNDQREAAQPIARTRGRDWAWSEGPRSQTPVVRSIRVQCLEDRWVLLPDSGNSVSATEISFDLSPRERAEKLAAAVQSRVESWGLALTGGYWKPVLSVQVGPNAQWRYTQLQRLLEGSGLEVQLRQAQ